MHDYVINPAKFQNSLSTVVGFH